MKTKNENHSPLPWYSITEGKSDSGLYVSSARFDGVTIAICKATTQDVADANISLIVLAVNHHEELVVAIKNALAANPYGVRIGGKWGDWRDELETVLSKL